MSVQIVPAAYLYLRRGDEVLLQQRHHTGYMDGHWVAGAAGHIELHETAAACAIREAAEELGIGIAEADLVPVTVMQRTDGTDNPREQRADWFFTATVWAGTPRVVEPDKCSDLEWFDLSALPEPIPAYERFVLNALRAGSCEPFSAYGF